MKTSFKSLRKHWTKSDFFETHLPPSPIFPLNCIPHICHFFSTDNIDFWLKSTESKSKTNLLLRCWVTFLNKCHANLLTFGHLFILRYKDPSDLCLSRWIWIIFFVQSQHGWEPSIGEAYCVGVHPRPSIASLWRGKLFTAMREQSNHSCNTNTKIQIQKYENANTEMLYV